MVVTENYTKVSVDQITGHCPDLISTILDQFSHERVTDISFVFRNGIIIYGHLAFFSKMSSFISNLIPQHSDHLSISLDGYTPHSARKMLEIIYTGQANFEDKSVMNETISLINELKLEINWEPKITFIQSKATKKTPTRPDVVTLSQDFTSARSERGIDDKLPKSLPPLTSFQAPMTSKPKALATFTVLPDGSLARDEMIKLDPKVDKPDRRSTSLKKTCSYPSNRSEERENHENFRSSSDTGLTDLEIEICENPTGSKKDVKKRRKKSPTVSVVKREYNKKPSSSKVSSQKKVKKVSPSVPENKDQIEADPPSVPLHQCPECQKMFNRKGNLTTHIKKIHQKPEEDESRKRKVDDGEIKDLSKKKKKKKWSSIDLSDEEHEIVE